MIPKVGNTSRTNLNARYLLPLGKQGVMTARLYGSHYDFELFSNFTFFLIDSVNGDQIRQRENRYLGGGDFRYDASTNAFGTKLRYTLGLSSRIDNTVDSELSRTLNRTTVLERLRLGDVSEQSGGAFSTVTAKFGKWTPQIGLRIDATRFSYTDALEAGRQTTASAARVSPKVELNYAATRSVQLYVKAGQGYHANDARLISSTAPRTLMPRAWGADLGVTAQVHHLLILTAAAWTLRSEQEFVYVGDAGS